MHARTYLRRMACVNNSINTHMQSVYFIKASYISLRDILGYYFVSDVGLYIYIL